MGAAFCQGHFLLLDKQAFTPDLGERAIQNLIAFGRHTQQLNGQATLAQQGLDMFSLPQRQTALTGGNDKRGIFQRWVHFVH